MRCLSIFRDRVAAASRLLLLVIVLATPGLAQASANGCAHLEEVVASAATGQDHASKVDCHERAAAPAEAPRHSDEGSDPGAPCCDVGVSCASPEALSASSDYSSFSRSLSQFETGLVSGYPSLNPIPDYPPPRA
jgi:hypothetical protein